jgi:hypothetical protein
MKFHLSRASGKWVTSKTGSVLLYNLFIHICVFQTAQDVALPDDDDDL